jgi:hypothetical protein
MSPLSVYVSNSSSVRDVGLGRSLKSRSEWTMTRVGWDRVADERMQRTKERVDLRVTRASRIELNEIQDNRALARTSNENRERNASLELLWTTVWASLNGLARENELLGPITNARVDF